jgi:hypothetical protein
LFPVVKPSVKIYVLPKLGIFQETLASLVRSNRGLYGNGTVRSQPSFPSHPIFEIPPHLCHVPFHFLKLLRGGHIFLHSNVRGAVHIFLVHGIAHRWVRYGVPSLLGVRRLHLPKRVLLLPPPSCYCHLPRFHTPRGRGRWNGRTSLKLMGVVVVHDMHSLGILRDGVIVRN